MIFDKTLLFYEGATASSPTAVSKILDLGKQVGDGQMVNIWIHADEDIVAGNNGGTIQLRNSDSKDTVPSTAISIVASLSGITASQVTKGVKLTIPIRTGEKYFSLTHTGLTNGTLTAGIVFDGQEAY